MKKQIFLITFSIAVTFACGQTKQSEPKEQEITISITDIRNQGVTYADKSTDGRKDGDVAVVRIIGLAPSPTKGELDTTAMYQIYFYKTYNSEAEKGRNWLQYYYMGVIDDKDYNKASYRWIPGNILSVTLFNSVTNIKRSVKLAPSGQQASIVN